MNEQPISCEQPTSNERLMTSLATALRETRRLNASVVLMLLEVDERRIHLELGHSSLFEFCIHRLDMSNGQAFYRTTAVSLAKQFPPIREALREDRIPISNIVLLRDLFTAENANRLLAEAAGKTKRQVQALITNLAPKPDVESRIRKYPARPDATAGRSPGAQQSASEPRAATQVCTVPAGVAPSESRDRSQSATASEPRAPKIPTSAQLQTLSEARHKVQFTASTALREKLELAQALMRHRNVDGDLAVVVERAIDALLEKLGKERFAATRHPRKPRPRTPAPAVAPAPRGCLGPSIEETTMTTMPARARDVAGKIQEWEGDAGGSPPSSGSSQPRAATKREVLQRDGLGCSFVGSDGKRCGSNAFLELDHRRPRATGGSNDASNLRLLCRAHNQFEAERVFGRDHIARAMDECRHKRSAGRDAKNSGAPPPREAPS